MCGRCCYHAICSCWGGGAGERDYRDGSADAAVTMLFAAVGCRCWGARRRRRICGRCCYHAICSCWGGGAGERDYRDGSADAAVTRERDGGDESADAAVTMLFAAVGVEVLGSETAETNLRTVLLPCYLQLLGWRRWGARLRRRICGRCCYHAICSCWGGGAGERDCGDESADGAATMLFAAVGVEVLGSETAETNLQTLLLPCYLQLLGCRCWGARRRRRICGRCCYHPICSCWGAVTMLFAAVGVEVVRSELGWRCWGARLRRRICGSCCYHAICSCWGGGAGERDCGDESADAAVTMLFAAVGVQLLGSETGETNLGTVLLPCYLQLLGCSCWGARRRRRICGRCCYHAICSCWGAAAGERDGGGESACCCHAICSCWGAAAGERDCGDESADAAVTMLFAAVGVQLLGSETTETDLRTLLLPCYLQLFAICSCWGGGAGERDCGDESADGDLQLLGCRCWGRRRICGRCCYHAICSCWGGGAAERDCGDESADGAVTICSCWGGGAGERDGGDESADGAVTMLFTAVGVQVPGRETEETNLRTLLLPCYFAAVGGGAGERDCGDESADGAVTMLFAAVGAGERDCGDESADGAVTMLFAAVVQLLGWRCCGARLRRRICGRCCYHACYYHDICSCWGGGAGERDCGDESADGAVTMLFAAVGVQVVGSETEETNLRMLLLPCYLQLLGWRCWGARLRTDAAVTMLFAAVGVQLLGSQTEETNLRTVLLPCYLQLLGWRCWRARRRRRIWTLLGSETEETNLRTVLLPCYLQLLGWGARLRRRICGRCCYHAICSCWGSAAADRDCRDESADGAVTMLFTAVGVQVLGRETEETNLRTVLLPCYLQLLGRARMRIGDSGGRRRSCGRWWWMPTTLASGRPTTLSSLELIFSRIQMGRSTLTSMTT